jgi:hypothetical protein
MFMPRAMNLRLRQKSLMAMFASLIRFQTEHASQICGIRLIKFGDDFQLSQSGLTIPQKYIARPKVKVCLGFSSDTIKVLLQEYRQLAKAPPPHQGRTDTDIGLGKVGP